MPGPPNHVPCSIAHNEMYSTTLAQSAQWPTGVARGAASNAGASEQQSAMGGLQLAANTYRHGASETLCRVLWLPNPAYRARLGERFNVTAGMQGMCCNRWTWSADSCPLGQLPAHLPMAVSPAPSALTCGNSAPISRPRPRGALQSPQRSTRRWPPLLWTRRCRARLRARPGLHAE